MRGMSDGHTQSAERLLGISEASYRLGVSVDTLRRWDSEGRLKATRTLGGQRRYRESEVEALVARPESSEAAS